MNNQQLSTTWLAQLPLNNIISCEPVSGGDINLAYQIKTTNATYFLKVQPQHPASYFDHEILSLKEIGQVANVPTPIAHGEINSDAYLILKWITKGYGDQYALGQEVAKMHQLKNEKFGFMDNHQTKVLVKDNHWNPSWCNFYINQRLKPEVSTAIKTGQWNKWRQTHFDRMVTKFNNYYSTTEVQPSLLHGDLWAGNFMFNQEHQPYLIDPDCIYGDREFDLAMTTVFGGFDEQFYRGYNTIYPIKPGINARLPWYKFYYLCMHLILFGESYGPAMDQILNNY
ncbi:fructosamine kinase family protein [Limosilactobacillus fastidiosus]|uniref:Fructosamine kinase family protein n=1 Tax=Limosilactobacillus fastidiosus TaxID=2759855 RepID=A0ABR6E6H9_9LACO|nr:fructosamine kinase family protein [Limosilactobacillus fastidiosus]MBB1062791.1 fructosamine kinase family protein [Limosilactobacillus fastidiosus]MCD7084796.1 fructosamine kinase family protein [Limosilactobacillus fastidiosus]